MRAVCFFFGCWAVGCMPAAGASGDYGVALAATALTVGAVAAHRAQTGDCWGHCGPGLACDMGSGLCVKAECDPACGDGEMCRLLPGGASCVAAPVTATQMTALRPISPGAAPAQSLGLPRAPGAGVAPYYLSPTYLLVPPPVLAPPPGAL